MIVNFDDHLALPPYWRYCALEHWSSLNRETLACDICNATIARNEGYLIGSSLHCEDCCINGLRSLLKKRLETKDYDENYFGFGMLDKARSFRYRHKELVEIFSFKKLSSSQQTQKIRCRQCGDYLLTENECSDGICERHKPDFFKTIKI